MVTEKEAIKWFEERFKKEIELGDKSELKIVFMTEEGAKVFTPSQLLDEMKKGTPIGLKHLEIIKRYLKWEREHGVMQK